MSDRKFSKVNGRWVIKPSTGNNQYRPRPYKLYYRLCTLNLSKKRVHCNNMVLDKCTLAGLIHEVAIQAGCHMWPIYTDIYWSSVSYSELVSELKKWLYRLEEETGLDFINNR